MKKRKEQTAFTTNIYNRFQPLAGAGKNAPELIEMCYNCHSRGAASERNGLFTSENNDIANQSVDTSFFTDEKNRRANQLASLARRDYFYLDAFWARKSRYVYNKSRSICMQMNSRALDL